MASRWPQAGLETASRGPREGLETASRGPQEGLKREPCPSALLPPHGRPRNRLQRLPDSAFAVFSTPWACRDAAGATPADEGPLVRNAILRAPKATVNPQTGKPFTPTYIRQVFRSLCYGDDPADPWDHQLPHQKTALPDELMQNRAAWAEQTQESSHTPAWYARNCIWIDPCSTIIPGSRQTAFHQRKSRKGKGKRWLSTASKQYPKNLPGVPYAKKQQQWGDGKAWWFIALTRGAVRLVPMGRDLEQTGDGMATFIYRLPGILRKMCGASAPLPRLVFSDRGPGFHQAPNGTIIEAYSTAVRATKLKAFAGPDASWQPPDLADLLMHETVAAWVRRYCIAHPIFKGPDLEKKWQRFEKGMLE